MTSKDKAILECWKIWQLTETDEDLKNVSMEWLDAVWQAIFIFNNVDVDLCDEMLEELNSVDKFKNYSKFREVFYFIPLEDFN
jgi:NTP pyrophosphatase (non-canonical NTP hydrolase)